MKLTIIIPVFNEEKTIEQVLQRINKLDLGKIDKEIIIVDDGSTDKTLNQIRKHLENKNISLYKHTENQGKGAAVRTALKKATGQYIIIQDADLEYDPKYIKKLLTPAVLEKIDVVYGTRLKRMPNIKKEEKTIRFLLHYTGNRLLSLITSLLYGQWITDMETGYKLMSKKALSGLKLNAKGFEFEPEITSKLLKRGYRIMEIPISVRPRGYKQGKKLSTFKDGPRAFLALVKYRFKD